MNSFSLGFNSLEQTALKGIRQSKAGIVQSMTRLSTGKRINSAKDDPAGLIASELLKSENVELRAKIKTTKELGNKYAVTDGYLSQIGNLLTDIKGAVVEGANTGALSDSQIDALQLQIDYALDSIQRFTQTAEYKGEKLLEGLFGALDGITRFAGVDATEVTSSVVDGKIVYNAAPSETASCPDRTIRTDSLATFTGLLFAAEEEEETGPLAEIAALLQSVAKTMTGDVGTTIELAEEEVAEEAAEEVEGTVEETVEEGDVPSESEEDAQTETVQETEVILSESDPYEAFFEMEREREADALDAEIDGAVETEAEAVEEDVAESDAVEIEEEAEEEIEEKKEFDVASTFVSGKPGDYWFRELDEFDFLNAVEAEEVVNAAGLIAEASSGFDPTAMLDQLTADSYSISALEPVVAESEEFFDRTLTETDDEEQAEGGRLADLRSGGSASLRNDPAKADRIIDQAIRGVSMMRAKVGAEQKYSIDTAVIQYEDQLVANTEAYSQITDADYAEEMTNLARNQLLLQMNIQVLNYSRNVTKMMVDMLDASMS